MNWPRTRRAVSMTSAWLSGADSTPAALWVMQALPSTSMPLWRATIASGTVDRPTPSAPIVRILMLYVVIESADAVMGTVLKAMGRQATDVTIFAVNPLCNLALNVWFVPVLGGVGSALAKLGGVICSCALRVVVVHRVTAMRWFRLRVRPAAEGLRAESG